MAIETRSVHSKIFYVRHMAESRLAGLEFLPKKDTENWFAIFAKFVQPKCYELVREMGGGRLGTEISKVAGTSIEKRGHALQSHARCGTKTSKVAGTSIAKWSHRHTRGARHSEGTTGTLAGRPIEQ